MDNLKDLSDYSAIKRLAAALHKFGANQHGAAIMIGAGFSRSAARHISGNKKMPLWDAFSKKLVKELYPQNKDLSFSDPLRVAEEYRAYYGQSALNDQIRSQIDDDAWRTGELYEKLLTLPWSEVMTTNWDTLLERAAKGIHGPYYTSVSRPSDLAWAPSPRIVKLHGTIGVTDNFVAAQEDYRSYTRKFAPFVNFARQVFIENELCLLGFSGEDPNFLQWAGWVRDHLTDHARKIYLVGALNLSAPQRVYLESINIAPVDLWGMVKDIQDRDLRHQTAITLFLNALSDEGKSYVKKHEWHLSDLHHQVIAGEEISRKYKDHEYAADLLKRKLANLKKDRESYPGWLVCPPNLQWAVKSQLHEILPSPKNIEHLTIDDRAKLLYEIAWRYSITFDYIEPWLADALLQIASQEEKCILSKNQQMEIALILLKNSRWLEAKDDSGEKAIEEYIQNITSLMQKNAHYFPDCAAELAYHQALIARDYLDYAAMEELVDKIQGEDPVWKIRKAAVLMELGRSDEGAKLIATAYGELRESHRHDLYSIPILSRFGWAYLLLKVAHRSLSDEPVEELPLFAENNYRKWQCDAFNWIESIRDGVEKKLETHRKEQKPIEPLFEKGRYRDNSKSRSFSNGTSEYLLLEGLTREAGIPLRVGSFNLLAGVSEKLALSVGTSANLREYTLAVRAADSEKSSSVKDVFTRIGLACTPKQVSDIFVDRLIVAIAYWRRQRSHGVADQRKHALSTLRVLMEVLARFVVRVSPGKSKEVFRLALSIGQQSDLHNIWLFEGINNLLNNSLSSIPKSDHGDLLADALAFPLPSEIIGNDFSSWPNPTVEYPNDRNQDVNLDMRINQLIVAVSGRDIVSRNCALMRLFPLVKKSGFLTPEELASLSTAIWGKSPDYKNLPKTGFFPFALLLLPSPDEQSVKSVVRGGMYGRSADILRDIQKEQRRFPSPDNDEAIRFYLGMANAAANKKVRMLPTPEQALDLFDQIMEWRPKKEENDFLEYAANDQRRVADSIGKALSYAIVPVLSDEMKTIDRFEKLRLFCENIEGSSSAIPSLVYFYKINDDAALFIERVIQTSLRDRDANKVFYAALAIQKWVIFSQKDRPQYLVRLVSKVIAIIESGWTVGLQHLINLINNILNEKWLSKQQKSSLIEIIPITFNAASYSNIDPSGRDAINASSIRERCVQLSQSLLKFYSNADGLKEILNQAKEDALPEVRFAVDVIEDE